MLPARMLLLPASVTTPADPHPLPCPFPLSPSAPPAHPHQVGAQDGGAAVPQYDYVFEDTMDFVKAGMLAGEVTSAVIACVFVPKVNAAVPR